MNNKKIIQKIVLGAVIIKNDKALIVQRSKDEKILPNMWELPSGKRELLENSMDSMLREVKEEVGLDVEIIMPFFIFDYQIEKTKEIRDSTQINFLAKTIDGNEVKLSSEHQNFAWIRENEIDRYNLSKPIKKTIQKAFELITELSEKK